MNEMPPFLCRLLARRESGQRALSHLEIAERAGLPKSTVADLSFKTSWADVRLDVASRFAAACGVDVLRPASQLYFFRRRRKAYLLRGGGHQRRMHGKLLSILNTWMAERAKR